MKIIMLSIGEDERDPIALFMYALKSEQQSQEDNILVDSEYFSII